MITNKQIKGQLLRAFHGAFVLYNCGYVISGVTTEEIGKLSSALRDFRRVFVECLWGGTQCLY